METELIQGGLVSQRSWIRMLKDKLDIGSGKTVDIEVPRGKRKRLRYTPTATGGKCSGIQVEGLQSNSDAGGTVGRMTLSSLEKGESLVFRSREYPAIAAVGDRFNPTMAPPAASGKSM